MDNLNEQMISQDSIMSMNQLYVLPSNEFLLYPNYNYDCENFANPNGKLNVSMYT